MKQFIMRNSFSFALITVILLFAFIFVYKFSAGNSENYIEVTIKHGDTLWELAEEYNYDRMDISSFIVQVKQLNELNDSNIKAGDVILIPVSDEVQTHLTMTANE
ncbi:LysM peptidoglycan-binding domain-containing protein [Bacillus sp. AGMB 02131]|uniref:LysM peptidoglycan-binding domain-containing protein n=1 Tax=Peribacillus faecalis TaxID=2772559 RepID=A0A927CT40_9BACI|nr:LysM peptidoglycan-binding domain-containing protein [Peribacillus faecalis]MBD3107372.1 LysM peptidoglycan-binding domain-containing protein [Peribacillus faecalis]